MSPTGASAGLRASDEIALHVPDPAAAAAFYVEVLGCREVARTEGWIELASGPLRLFLVRDPAPAHDATVLSFDAPDRAAALERLRERGCTLVPVGPHAPGEHYVRDPFGVVFDVLQRGG